MKNDEINFIFILVLLGNHDLKNVVLELGCCVKTVTVLLSQVECSTESIATRKSILNLENVAINKHLHIFLLDITEPTVTENNRLLCLSHVDVTIDQRKHEPTQHSSWIENIRRTERAKRIISIGVLLSGVEVTNQWTSGVGDAKVRHSGSDDGAAANECRHGGLEGGREEAGKCHCVEEI